MKQKILSSVLFAVALLAALPANAYDFMVKGIAYNITGNGTVEVTDGGSYSGNIIIPGRVTYKGTTYSVTTIGERAFCGCHGLTAVTIPNSVTTIGYRAFAFCSVTDVTIPNAVTTIGKSAFYYCRDLTNVTIGNSVKAIGELAFADCWNLKTMTIPNSVTSIGDRAFGDCRGLTTVTIPNSVTTIGEGAFSFCTGLTSVTIPNSVTSIGDWAFNVCNGLNSIYAYPDPSKCTVGENAFMLGSAACVLRVPSYLLDAYKASPQWKDFEHIEPLR